MKDTNVSRIVSHIRKEIMHGKLKGGDHLTEVKISKLFKISRVPVREAFRVLHSEGYLEMIPNRGSFVRKISGHYIEEINKLYLFIAPELLSDAIPKYTKKDFAKANSILSKIEKCKDFNKIGYLLWDFAKTIYGPSEKKFMLFIMDELYKHNIRILNELFEIKQRHYDLSSHIKFLELCRQKKNTEAIKVWIKYVESLKDIFKKMDFKNFHPDSR